MTGAARRWTNGLTALAVAAAAMSAAAGTVVTKRLPRKGTMTTSTSAASSDSATSIAGMAPLAGSPNLLASGVPDIPAGLKARLGQYLNARAATLADVAPDGGSVLISTRFANTAQLHLVAGPGADRRQLTFFDEPVGGGKFLPSAGGGANADAVAGTTTDTAGSAPILFLQDIGGGEAYQIFALDRRTGRPAMLTDGKSRHGGLVLSHDGRRAAFGSTARNGRDTDVYVMDLPATAEGLLSEGLAVRTARRVTQTTGTWSPGGFSPDATRLLVGQYRSINDADLHVLELADGRMTRLTPESPKASVGGAEFSADGRSVYLVTDRGSDFNELVRIDLPADVATAAGDASTTSSALWNPVRLSADIPWNVEDFAVAPAGGAAALAACVNEDGLSRLYLLKPGAARLAPLDLPEPGVASGLRFAKAAPDRLFFTADTARSPSDVMELDVAAGRFVRWTRSEIGGLDPSTFVPATLVRYPSTDGVVVPAFLFKPASKPGAGAKLPVLVVWHGGPEGQSRPNFAAFVQYLANELGLAVLMPNVRGSDGYGKAFLAADDGVKREASLADIGATLDWIATQPDLDADRVGVYGGSYGGYMVLCTAAFHPGRIRAAVDVVGVSSIPSFLNNTQPYRRDLRREEYGDERDPAVRAVQERISPLNAVERITAAMFVQQGKNDPRVPQSEAEQIVSALRAKRGDDPDACWYLLALDEGHGFAKKANRDAALQATVLFLKQRLLGETESPTAKSR